MLKTLLLVDDSPRPVPLHNLQRNCRSFHRCASEAEIEPVIGIADAVVLHTPRSKMQRWQATVAGLRRLPILWLCTESDYPKEMDWGYALDGVLFASMTSGEMLYALKWGLRSHQQHKRWMEEREQLLQRLEERKWIDQAKAVLCEIKGISEAEAYDFLRKQAMNERKRIGDIAASIVKVYQLIHG